MQHLSHALPTNMLSNFFSLGARNYLNNAVVIADALEKIGNIFGDVGDFIIKFRQPFNCQADFNISTSLLDGCVVGSFVKSGVTFYFSYVPNNISLMPRSLLSEETPYFNLFYAITNTCRGKVESTYIENVGKMTDSDKVIFAIASINDTRIVNEYARSNNIPKIITTSNYIGNSRIKLSVFLNDVYIGDRFSTVKEFSV